MRPFLFKKGMQKLHSRPAFACWQASACLQPLCTAAESCCGLEELQKCRHAQTLSVRMYACMNACIPTSAGIVVGLVHRGQWGVDRSTEETLRWHEQAFSPTSASLQNLLRCAPHRRPPCYQIRSAAQGLRRCLAEASASLQTGIFQKVPPSSSAAHWRRASTFPVLRLLLQARPMTCTG